MKTKKASSGLLYWLKVAFVMALWHLYAGFYKLRGKEIP